MNKLLIVVGATATGKTGLGIRLARRFGGEIVSADSRQVYQEMDIITGKETSDEVKIWLDSLVKPNYRFNVADYVACARPVIEDIWRRGKLPILVGGTGFYIKALVDGVATLNIKPDESLRAQLAGCSVSQLVSRLKSLDLKKWQQMNQSDRRNPRRLIRAIEVASQSTQSHPRGVTGSHPRGVMKAKKLFIGLTAPYKFLYQRIDRRVDQRVKAGAEQEARRLFKKYGQNSVLSETIGYQQWQEYFAGRISRQEAIKRWRFAEHAYARRQISWFKRDPRIKWFDIRHKKWQDEVEAYVAKS